MTPLRPRAAYAGPLGALLLLLSLLGCGGDPSDRESGAGVTSSPTPTETATPQPPTPLRGAFADDFDGPTLDPAWRWLHDTERWPDQMRSVAVADGALELEPWTTAWFEDHHGPMVYREVTGDFVATARVRSRGLRTEVPRKSYSFTGLIARAPRDVTPRTWQPGGEDHVFVTSGVADDPGVLVLETKTTDDSHSVLTLDPIDQGWTDMAVVRAGESFVMLYREPRGAWTVSEVFLRPDLPPTVQLGVVVYTDWEDMADFHSDADGYHRTVLEREPDLRASVDHVSVQALPGDLDVGGFGALDPGQLEEALAPLLR